MLSIENPPSDRPSCSPFKISGVKGDERAAAVAHDKLALQKEEAAAASAAEEHLVGISGLAQETQLPHFSIRDYVVNARRKNIGANWPFPQHFLQLCLKHGVKDILPPFEPPDLVRAQCCRKRVGPSEVISGVETGKELAEADSLGKDDAGLSDLGANDLKREPCQRLNQSVLESSDRVQSPSQAEGNLDWKSCSNESDVAGNTFSTLTSHLQTDINSKPAHQVRSLVNEINGSSEASIDLEIADPCHTSKKTESSFGPSDRKYRLIVKLGGISESSRTEEILSNSSAAVEPMASKVCPVCKTFSSTSNTTLNAHMDQCLAVESSSKQAMTDVTKHKVKPRKKRSMVDICATAPRCTLEELDRRNGTTWAVECSLPMQNCEVRSETKRPRLARVDVPEDGDDRAVYVDSNGTKVRILSKFDDVVTPTVGVDSMPRKHVKDVKEGKSYIFSKKKHLAAKCSKYLKLKPQSKKMCSRKLYKDETREPSDRKHRIENHEEKEKSLSQLLESQDPVKPSDSGTLQQWVCSKRTRPSKKMSNRDGHGRRVGVAPTTRNLVIGSIPSTSRDSPIERRHILKFSRSSDKPTTSPRSKRVEILSKTISMADNGGKSRKPVEGNFCRLSRSASVADGGMLKFAKAPKNYISSPRNKKVDINSVDVQVSPQLSRRPPLSTLRKDVLFKKSSLSMEVNRCNVIEKCSAFQRSQWMAEMSEPDGDSLSDADERYNDRMNDSSEMSEPSSTSLNNITGTHNSDVSKNMRSEREESSDEESIDRSDVADSGHEIDQMVGMYARQETVASEWSDPEAEWYSPAMADMLDSQADGSHEPSPSAGICHSKLGDQLSAVEVPNSGDTGVAFLSVGAAEEPLAAQNSEEHLHIEADHSSMQSPSLEDECVGPTSQFEVCLEPTAMRSFDHQEIGCVDVGDEITGLNSQMTAEADSRMEGDSMSEIQYAGCVTGPTQSMQGPGSCFPCPGNVGYDVLQDNASVTSSGPQLTQDKHKSVDHDQSRSPASATSTISSPPPPRSDPKYSDQKLSSGVPSVQVKSSGGFVVTDPLLPSMMKMGGMERTKLEMEMQKVTVPLVKELPKFPNDLPCCCTRKESLSRATALFYQEPQLLRRRSLMTSILVPAKAKQMISNQYVGQEIPTTSVCTSSRIDDVVPVLEVPIDSVSMRAASDVTAVKRLDSGDFGSSSLASHTQPHQPSSNSVFRLMGKNLTVGNKEEDEAMQFQKVPPTVPTPNDHQNTKYLTLLGFPMSNIFNKDVASFYGQTPVGSVVDSNCCNQLQNFNVSFQNSFRNRSNSKIRQTPLQSSNCLHPAMSMGGLMGPMLQQGTKSLKTDLQPQQKRLNKKPSSPFAYDVERMAPHCQHPKPVSMAQVANPVKEVIVIDDSPEFEADLSKANGKYNVASRGKHLSQSQLGVLPPTVWSPTPTPVKAFSCCPSNNTSLTEPPVAGTPKPSYLAPCPGANASSTKQGTSEGPHVLSHSYILPLPPTGYLNSALYYSPSLR